MIRAVYERGETVLRVSGHAGAGEKGADLVCAAASALAFTALECVQNEAERFLPSVLRRSGELRIACRPGRRSAAACRRVFDTVFTGFELLAKEYPAHVSAIKEE